MIRTPLPLDVIIPVFGAGPQLERTLDALQRQAPSVGRIIVSHSGDGDPTARLADRGVTVLHSRTRLYAGAARNRGLAVSDAAWIAFVDEDVVVADGWHAALLEAAAADTAECLLGSIGWEERGGYWGMAVWFIEFGSVHPYLPARPVMGGGSGNMAVDTAAFRAIGGFPEDWRRAQDSVVHARLRAAGQRVWFVPRAVGRHVNLPGFHRMLRHLHDSGAHAARLRRARGELPGAVAVRHPVLSLGLWLARLAQLAARVIGAQRGPLGTLLLHAPAIIVGLLAWNAGFSRVAFRRDESA